MLRLFLTIGRRDLEKRFLLSFVGFEADLQHPIAKRVAVQCANSQHCFLVICHGYETITFALTCRIIFYYLNTLHCSKWSARRRDERNKQRNNK